MWIGADPLAEKYNTWSPYTFSGDRVIDARELEGLEPDVLFKSRNNAAINFAKIYNVKSIENNKEYASGIYAIKKDNKIYYAYNKPNEDGSETGANVNKKIPNGAALVAVIHTHSAYAIYKDGDNFSDEEGDKDYSKKIIRDMYVVTPSGKLLVFDLSSGSTIVVSSDLPSDPTDPQSKKNIYNSKEINDLYNKNIKKYNGIKATINDNEQNVNIEEQIKEDSKNILKIKKN